MREQLHYQGDNGWEKVSAYLDSICAKNILLITGRRSYTSSGAEQMLAPCLKGRTVTKISDCEPNPKAEDLSRIFDEVGDKQKYDVIIAVGGGSIIDTAKLLKAFWFDPKTIDKHLDTADKLPSCELPLIAIPTTAGSGSEATRFAVLYRDRKKYSVEGEELLPDFSVVIPSLLRSAPKHISASSGMDALCQGIESYWSIHSTGESRDIAGEAIKLAWNWIEQAVNNRNSEALHHMARASHLAGRAINITKTTAPHAVSYPMTSYFGITHGHAVGLLTARFLKYNADVTKEDCLDPRGPNFVICRLQEIASMLPGDNNSCSSGALTEKLKAIGLETSFVDLGIINQQDIETIVAHGFDSERVMNNPRAIKETTLKTLIT
ncbi:MAG: phosphonoacetaldehyde reductase [Akkermansiaceae bacterium]